MGRLISTHRGGENLPLIRPRRPAPPTCPAAAFSRRRKPWRRRKSNQGGLSPGPARPRTLIYSYLPHSTTPIYTKKNRSRSRTIPPQPGPSRAKPRQTAPEVFSAVPQSVCFRFPPCCRHFRVVRLIRRPPVRSINHQLPNQQTLSSAWDVGTAGGTLGRMLGRIEPSKPPMFTGIGTFGTAGTLNLHPPGGEKMILIILIFLLISLSGLASISG